MNQQTLEANYRALSELVGQDIGEWASQGGRTLRFTAPGMMDLHLETLYKNRVSMSHYFKMNGDLVPDPDMEIEVDPVAKAARAQHFQDQFGYWEVYEGGTVNLEFYVVQNEFLETWLANRSFYKKEPAGEEVTRAIKCLYCLKIVPQPNAEEETTSICDTCSKKDHEENP